MVKKVLFVCLLALLCLGCESSNGNFVFSGQNGGGTPNNVTLNLPGAPPAGAVTARISFFGPVIARANVRPRGTLLGEREFPVGDFPVTLVRPDGTDSLSCEFLDGDKKVLGLFVSKLNGDNIDLIPEPAAPFFTGLTVTTPDSTLDLNQVVQLQARATTPFGTTIVTELADWTSNSGSVTVSNQAGTRGQATGQSVGNSLITSTLTFDRPNLVVSDQGRLAAYHNGTLLHSFFAFSDQEQNPRVAVGDVDGDGVEDIIAGSSSGRPQVRIFSGKTTNQLTDFFAFDNNFTGGIFVASGNLGGDASDEIVVGSGAGSGPVVKVFDPNGTQRDEFFAYDQSFLGGVRVAAADVNNDGVDDIITGPSSGSGQVKIFDGASGQLGGAQLGSFFAFDPGFTGGVFVAGGDINGDGNDDIIVGSGSGQPRVRVFDGTNSAQLFDFQPFSPDFTGGVRVGSSDINGDGRDDIVTGGDQLFYFDGINGDRLAGFPEPRAGDFGGVPGLRPSVSATGVQVLSVATTVTPDLVLSPSVGLAGQRIEITGSGFVSGSTQVKFGPNDGLNVSVLSPTRLQVDVPPLTGLPVVDVSVETAGSPTLTRSFGYVVRLTSPDPQAVAHFGGTFDLDGGAITGGKSIAVGNFDGVNGLDLAIGEPRATANGQAQAGRVHIFYNDGQGRFGNAGLTLAPFNLPNSLGGFALAAGDVDNDGQTDDLLVGAPGAAQVAHFRGVFNNQSFLAPGFMGATVGGATSRFGSSIAVGNLDADAALEMAIGSPFSALFGAQSGLVEFYDHNLTRLEGFSGGAGSRRGQSLLLGDSNNDNVADSYEGAPGQNSNQGQIELRPGTGTVPRFTGASVIFGPPGGGERGFSMDLGSTRPDLAVGNPRSTVNTQAGAGTVEVFFSDGAGGEAGRTVLQSPNPATDAGFGAFLSFADLTATGSRDLVISAPFAQVGANTQAGQLHFFLRNAVDSLLLDRTLTSPTPDEGDQFGHSVTSGDLNGDGFEDVVVSAPFAQASGTGQAGEVFIFYSPTP